MTGYVCRDKESVEESAAAKPQLSPTQVSHLVTRTPSFNRSGETDAATADASKPASALPAHLRPEEVGDLIRRTPSFRYKNRDPEFLELVFFSLILFLVRICFLFFSFFLVIAFDSGERV